MLMALCISGLMGFYACNFEIPDPSTSPWDPGDTDDNVLPPSPTCNCTIPASINKTWILRSITSFVDVEPDSSALIPFYCNSLKIDEQFPSAIKLKFIENTQSGYLFDKDKLNFCDYEPMDTVQFFTYDFVSELERGGIWMENGQRQTFSFKFDLEIRSYSTWVNCKFISDSRPFFVPNDSLLIFSCYTDRVYQDTTKVLCGNGKIYQHYEFVPE